MVASLNMWDPQSSPWASILLSHGHPWLDDARGIPMRKLLSQDAAPRLRLAFSLARQSFGRTWLAISWLGIGKWSAAFLTMGSWSVSPSGNNQYTNKGGLPMGRRKEIGTLKSRHRKPVTQQRCQGALQKRLAACPPAWVSTLGQAELSSGSLDPFLQWLSQEQTRVRSCAGRRVQKAW